MHREITVANNCIAPNLSLEVRLRATSSSSVMSAVQLRKREAVALGAHEGFHPQGLPQRFLGPLQRSGPIVRDLSTCTSALTRLDTGIKLRRVWQLYGMFGPHLKPYWKWFVLAYAGLIGTILMNLVKPWPLKLIFDYILLDKPMPEEAIYFTFMLGNEKPTLFIIFCISIVLVVFLDSLFSYSHKYLMAAAGERVINDIRRWVFDHMQVLPQSFHGTSRSGDLTLRLTSDINAIKKLLIGSVQTFATYLLTFAGLIITMLWMDWRLTLVALAVVPPLYVMSFRFSRKVEVLEKTKRAKESEVASIVQETMTSMPVVQAFTQEDQERQRFAKATDESLMADLKKMRLSRTVRRAVQLLMASGTALVVWYGARRALAGEVTPGDLIVFAAYLKDLYGPIGGFSELVMDFLSAVVGSERIAAIIGTDMTVKDEPSCDHRTSVRGRSDVRGRDLWIYPRGASVTTPFLHGKTWPNRGAGGLQRYRQIDHREFAAEVL